MNFHEGFMVAMQVMSWIYITNSRYTKILFIANTVAYKHMNLQLVSAFSSFLLFEKQRFFQSFQLAKKKKNEGRHTENGPDSDTDKDRDAWWRGCRNFLAYWTNPLPLPGLGEHDAVNVFILFLECTGLALRCRILFVVNSAHVWKRIVLPVDYVNEAQGGVRHNTSRNSIEESFPFFYEYLNELREIELPVYF